MRLAPDAIGGARSAPAARQRADLRHQRQDDHRRDGRRHLRAGRACALVYNRAGANMAGGIATTLLSAARRARAHRRRARAVRGRRAVAGAASPRSCIPVRCCSPTCSATSSTATASSTRSPRAGSRALGDGAVAAVADRRRIPAPGPERPLLVLNADDPLIADLGRERHGVLYFGVQDDSLALAGHGACRRREALPPMRRTLRVRRRLPGPPRPLPLPELRAEQARAGSARHAA